MTRAFELAAALVFGALGVRSIVYWTRRPFEGTDVGDHVLFALFVTGRAGMWLGVGGIFLVYAHSTDEEGKLHLTSVGQFRWYLLVFAFLLVVQLLAGYFLGKRGSSGGSGPEADGPPTRQP